LRITAIVWLVLVGISLFGAQIVAATPEGTNAIANPIQIANLRVLDVNGIQRSFYYEGQQLELGITLDIVSGYVGNVVVVTEIRNEYDVTMMIDAKSVVLTNSGQTVSSPWVPETKGEYELRSLVLQSFYDPVLLSSLVTKTVKIDNIRVQKYYESNEAAIAFGVADEKVQQLFNGQEMTLLYVRAFGVGFPGCQGACGIVYLHNGNNSEGVDLGIDLLKKQVISIRLSPRLISEDPFEAFSLVEDDPARASIKFRQPMPLKDFVAINSHHGITVHYVGYVSNTSGGGHGSVWEPFDAEGLETKLEAAGEKLIGISSFSGLAKSKDWLEFLRSNGDSPSLESLEIRGSKFVECLASKEQGAVIC
jgi:hypothetical protein